MSKQRKIQYKSEAHNPVRHPAKLSNILAITQEIYSPFDQNLEVKIVFLDVSKGIR